MIGQAQEIIERLARDYGISEGQVRYCAGVTQANIEREFEVVRHEREGKGLPLDNFLIWLEAEKRLLDRFFAGG